MSKQNCRGSNQGQLWLDTIGVFVLKAGFELVGLRLTAYYLWNPEPAHTKSGVAGAGDLAPPRAERHHAELWCGRGPGQRDIPVRRRQVRRGVHMRRPGRGVVHQRALCFAIERVNSSFAVMPFSLVVCCISC